VKDVQYVSDMTVAGDGVIIIWLTFLFRSWEEMTT
jgi:hypothetical protein